MRGAHSVGNQKPSHGKQRLQLPEYAQLRHTIRRIACQTKKNLHAELSRLMQSLAFAPFWDEVVRHFPVELVPMYTNGASHAPSAFRYDKRLRAGHWRLRPRPWISPFQTLCLLS